MSEFDNEVFNMTLEVWYNPETKQQLTLEPDKCSDWYLEIIRGSRCVTGINKYWLLNNGFKRRI